MPAPDAIFIDTGIFDQECYDFFSSRVQALLAAISVQSKTLLLPQPTKQEILKHINQRAQEAIVSLVKARESHALLRGRTGVPQNRQQRDEMVAQLRSETLTRWADFQSQFNLCELDYSGVNLGEVMAWYNQVTAPFGPGDKQKEFPDAFALAAVRTYAAQTGRPVAVVSTDNDFKKFCENVPALRFYPTLDALTAELVVDANAIRAGKAAFFAQISIPTLIDLLKSAFPDRGFWHELAPADEDDNVDNIVATKCEITPDDIQVVAVTDNSFTVSFRAEVTYTADVAYADPDSWVSDGDGDVMYLHRCEGNVTDTATIHGSVCFETDAPWSEILEIKDLKIEEDFIWVREAAPQVDDRDYDDHNGHHG